MVVWAWEIPSPPSPLPPVAGGRADPEVLRVEDLVLPLTGYTQENMSCTSPRQHSRAGFGSVGAGELTPEGMRTGELALPLTGCSSLDSWAHLSPVAPRKRAALHLPGQHSGAGPVVGVWLSCPKGMSVGELTCLLWVMGVEMMPSALSPFT